MAESKVIGYLYFNAGRMELVRDLGYGTLRNPTVCTDAVDWAYG